MIKKMIKYDRNFTLVHIGDISGFFPLRFYVKSLLDKFRVSKKCNLTVLEIQKLDF